MDKLKYIKLENEDGSYSESIPLSVDSDYVDVNGAQLTKVLEGKATKSEVEAVSSGSPSGVYSTLSSLQTADPSHEKIYLVVEDGKWYYYNTTTNTWTGGGQYLTSSDSLQLTHYGSIEIVPPTGLLITFSKNADNSLIINTPNTLYAFIEPNNINNAFYTVNLTNTTYTLKNNELLIFNLNSKTLEIVTQTQFRQNIHDFILLIWNHYGNIKGQWYKYFQINNINETKSLVLALRHYNNYEVVPPTLLKIYFDVLQNNKIRITTPDRLFIFTEATGTNAFFTVSLAETVYDIDNNQLLVLDLSTYSLSVVTQTQFKQNVENFILLVWNHYGNIKGQWYKYFQMNLISNNSVNTNPCVDIMSRQGSNGGYPENTLIGFKHAKEYGYNHVRVSFGWTLDGIPICCHNEYLYESTLRDNSGEIITDQTIKLSNMNYSDIIANYDAGIYCGSDFAGIRVPKLEDVLLQCRKMGQKVDIEYKFGYNSVNLQNLLQLIYKYGMQDIILFSVWSTDIIDEIRNSDYPLKIGMIRHLDQQAVNLAIEKNVDRLDIFKEDAYDENLVLELHKHNIKVKMGSAYTSDNANTYINQYDVIECGVIVNPLI